MEKMNLHKATSASQTTGSTAFDRFVKPQLYRLLSAVGLDVVYERGQGDLLFLTGASACEEAVLDLLGGYGASLMGHNHPELVSRAQELLAAGRPFNAQASARSYAGLLAERMTTFANSGAEAIEAAIKHAEYERIKRVDALNDSLQMKLRIIRRGLREGRYQIDRNLFSQAKRFLQIESIHDLHDLGFHLLQFNAARRTKPGLFLALQGAFHGKTTGALQLTYNPDFRDPWRHIGFPVKFLPFNDSQAAREIVSAYTDFFIDLDISVPGEIKLAKRSYSDVTACIVEPIQGEGGIRVLDSHFLATLRELADTHGFPLIIDEIQTMGRTGSFLATEQDGIHGDYYTFSKALGGGLAKISALLVRKDRYIESFGYLHTSTFADDCFSSAIGLGVLDLLCRDDSFLLRECARKGEYLKSGLERIGQQYPGIISDIRGRGLMLGVAFCELRESQSPLIRVLSEQHLLSFMISGFLLNELRIRVAPTVSAHQVIRIEPSAYITQEQLDECLEGFRHVCDLLARGDSFTLCRYMAEADQNSASNEVQFRPNFIAKHETANGEARFNHRVAFIGHFLEAEDLVRWDRALQGLSPTQCEALLDRTRGIVEPFIAGEYIIRSATGTQVGLTLIGAPLSSNQFAAAMNAGDTEDVIDQIQQAVDIARNQGAGIIGFGGYTSIITQNWTRIAESAIGLTSGNSLTAAAAIEALIQAAALRGIDLKQAKLGIVGAVGNIGRVLAEVLADEVGRIRLISRERGHRRLQKLIHEIWRNKLLQPLVETRCGIDAITVATQAYSEFVLNGDINDFLTRLEQELAEEQPIALSTTLDSLLDCDLIITATNSPEPILFPRHVGSQPVVICDVAVPHDVDPSMMQEKPNVTLIQGGQMTLPGGQHLETGVMSLPRGHIYACMAETIILGLSGMYNHFSYGPLLPAKVRQIRDLAKLHGFTFDIKHSIQDTSGLPDLDNLAW
jgi:acetylornithine/succinyldiaminopimelate/putrescine aminotransferase/predicted amino acid dehydrogenase